MHRKRPFPAAYARRIDPVAIGVEAQCPMWNIDDFE